MAGQVLVELLLESLEAVSVGRTGTETGEVEAWSVGQVDGEGFRQYQQLIFLQGLAEGQAGLAGTGQSCGEVCSATL
jgi:hypothetical protein